MTKHQAFSVARRLSRHTHGTIYVLHHPEEFETRRTGYQTATDHEIEGYFGGAWDRVIAAYEDGNTVG